MVGGAVEFKEGQISIPSSGYAITPKLDLTGLKKPRLVLYNAQRSYLYIQSSKDGINFTPLDTCFNEQGTYMVELPSDAVKLKFLSGDIKDLQIYDAYREPISVFPYIESFETKESLYNWTIEGGVNRYLGAHKIMVRDDMETIIYQLAHHVLLSLLLCWIYLLCRNPV